MPILTISSSDNFSGGTFVLRKVLTSIGSARGNDLVLDTPEVESNHALIQLVGDGFEIQAVARGCEIRVNGRKKKKARLAHGDEVQIGGVDLAFSMFGPVEASSQPPSRTSTS